MLKRLQAAISYIRAFRSLGHGQPESAYAGFDAFLKVVPNHAYAHCNRGLALQMLNRHEQAFADFSRAIEIAPRLMMPYHNRGISSKMTGEFERAIVDLDAAIVRNSKYAASHGELGVVRTILHDYDRAILNLTKAIDLDPKNPAYWGYRGYTLFHSGDFTSAGADLRQAVKLGGDAYTVLFSFLTQARLGINALAQLKADTENLKAPNWPIPVSGLFLGNLNPASLLVAAPKLRDKAESQFYIGQWHLLRDNRIAAVEALRAAMQGCPVGFVEQTGAVAELRRLGMSIPT
jgi:tetratricopeptide (TPR) repeat protein